MDQQALRYIQVNRDAVAVNRGFYYQYLQVLKKWVINFIQQNPAKVYTEVGDDIKEIGDRLVFTQIKSYTESFSLRSKTLQTSLFNFFTLFLEGNTQGLNILFCFQTNAAISTNEKLLQAWNANQGELNGQLLTDCREGLKKILSSVMKKKRDNLLSASSVSATQRTEIKTAFSAIAEELDKPHFDDFIHAIKWEFLDKAPDTAVEELYHEILGLLEHDCFSKKPVHILMEVLLSQIYKCSQRAMPQQRMVDNGLMVEIISRKISELDEYSNRKFLDLLDLRFSFVYQSLKALQSEVKSMRGEITSLHAVHKSPRELTLLPHINKSRIVKNEGDLETLHASLTENKHLVIAGTGGIGKSLTAKGYLHEYNDQYDHLAWINCESGFIKALVFEEGLLNNLNISFAREKNEGHIYREVLQQLNRLSGNNLLVLDDFNDESLLDEVKSLGNWKILLTSRKRLPDTFSYKLSTLSAANAKRIYRLYESRNTVGEETFDAFFEIVAFNPLLIELSAKTIHNSLDMDLAKLTTLFNEQLLDDEELDIDIKVDGIGSTRLLKMLMKTFDISDLTSDQSHFLEFLSVLPKDIKISDLVTWYGKWDAKTNKIAFVNLVNGLHNSGWLERNGDDVHLHTMIQEAVLYRLREGDNFITLTLQLNWLAHRIREGIVGDFAQALRFLRYGEALLFKIKEEYRASIYQPLLVLENEVLNVYTWLSGKTNLLERTRNLLSRASAYLGAESGLVGVMYNNLGMALVEKGLYKDAEPELLRSADILGKNPKGMEQQYVYTMSNLALLCLELGDLGKFKEWFDHAMDFRKAKKLFDDPSFPFQCGMLGFAQQGFANHDEAIRMFNIAIKAHNELPVDKQNDLNLILYLNNVAFSYVMTNREDKAYEVLKEAVSRLEKISIRHNNKLIHILIKTITGICEKSKSDSGLNDLLAELERIRTEANSQQI